MSAPTAAPVPRRYDDELGWCALPELLAPADVRAVLDACDQLMALPATERDPSDKPVQGTRHLERLDERIPLVGQAVIRTDLLTEVDAILRADFTLTQASFRCPHPGFGGQRLHADDTPLATAARPRVATAIVALTEFTVDNGATRVIPGSHHRPDLQRQSGALDAHPDEQILTGPAGTAFLFNGHVLHAGGHNNGVDPRPALQLLWRPTR